MFLLLCLTRTIGETSRDVRVASRSVVSETPAGGHRPGAWVRGRDVSLQEAVYSPRPTKSGSRSLCSKGLSLLHRATVCPLIFRSGKDGSGHFLPKPDNYLASSFAALNANGGLAFAATCARQSNSGGAFAVRCLSRSVKRVVGAIGGVVAVQCALSHLKRGRRPAELSGARGGAA
jgi:hypothetical protein